ncbi:tetratricopeptide repeat protein [Desulfovibrio inopinatus]|uniref:tetratricopeptide repeat protein n=1 Tax=Desulfovibrio inopinatus TaxID=102109 RepID=UPI00041325CD|nr:tetratricopeptide repeat protein [Desulfovibrio inopinatus]
MLFSRVLLGCMSVFCMVAGLVTMPNLIHAQNTENPYRVQRSHTSEPQDMLSRLRLLAETGDGDACYTLGAKYINGDGLPQDYNKGVQWLKLAAEKNNAFAQFDLARVYLVGFGEFKKNKKTAYFWANLAAAHDTLSPRELDKAMKLRNLVEDELTEDEVNSTQSAATDWLERHKANMP